MQKLADATIAEFSCENQNNRSPELGLAETSSSKAGASAERVSAEASTETPAGASERISVGVSERISVGVAEGVAAGVSARASGGVSGGVLLGVSQGVSEVWLGPSSGSPGAHSAGDGPALEIPA